MTLEELRRPVAERIIDGGYWPVSLVTPAGPPYFAHHHAVDEILFVLEGRLEFWDVLSGHRFSVRKAEGLRIPAGVIHCVRRDQLSTYMMGMSKPVDLDEFMIFDPELEEVSKVLIAKWLRLQE